MNFCFHCGKELPEGSGFCPYCGTQLASPAPQESAAPVYEQPVCPPPVYGQPPAYTQPPAYPQPPVYTPPVQQPPVYSQPAPSYQPPIYGYQPPAAPPPPSTAAKVMGYISMGLALSPFVFGFFLLVALSSAYHGTESLPAIFGILGLLFGIPAKILSSKAAQGNFRSAPTRLGSIFGVLSIVFGAIFFTVAFL